MGENVTFAKASCVTEHGGRAIHLHAGEVWAADDPFVLAQPHFFGPSPAVRRTAPAPAPPIEQATRAPGERRGATRGR